MKTLCTSLSFVSLALLSSLLLPSTAAAEEEEDEWQYLETREGVVIYERAAERLGQYALRAVVEADIAVGQVVSVFVDPAERPHWVYRVSDEETLESEDDQGHIWSERYWTRVNMPFPVSDRDYVLLSLYEFHPDQKKVTANLQSIDDPRKPAAGCCVRGESSIEYTVQALSGQERTRIEVIIETDLKGSVSDRLIRSAGPDWPFHTLKNLLHRAGSKSIVADQRVQNWHD